MDRWIARLLDIALEEFTLTGFGGTSLDRLVERSCVSKMTIYRRFGSKEGLFKTLIDRSAASIRDHIWSLEMDPTRYCRRRAAQLSSLERVAAGKCL